MIGRVSDAAVDASVVPTLRSLYSSLSEAGAGPSAGRASEWERQVLAQQVALLEYVAGRGGDPTPDRIVELRIALDALGSNPLVPADGGVDERAAAALVAAVGRDDDDAIQSRRRLRPVLVAELDAELAETMCLMDGFRGRVSAGTGGSTDA
jgi:hypothetical protein